MLQQIGQLLTSDAFYFTAQESTLNGSGHFLFMAFK